MGELLKKAEENRQASLKLWSVNNWYAPSIHCAYYACVQLMIHILMVVGKKEHSVLESEISVSGGGSHVYYIRQVQNLLVNKGKVDKVKMFSEIKSLKAYREKSDYKPIAITFDDSEKAITLSDKIYFMLKTEFKV